MSEMGQMTQDGVNQILDAADAAEQWHAKALAKPDVHFILTSDNRLGICWTPNKEAGGTEIIRWCPPEMIKQAYRRILDDELKV